MTRAAVLLALGSLSAVAPSAYAQQQPVASVATSGVQVGNALSVSNGRATLANNGQVTAGEKTATVALARGGTVQVCASTTLRLARDTSANTAQAGLMLSLDRGAFETDYNPAAFSDVILTPDLRMLVSGPGHTLLRVRVNEQGDTCVDNSGSKAPYVTVSSLFDGGAYRVSAGQRVLFVHG